MQAAQVLKAHREASEPHERRKDDEHHDQEREDEDYDESEIEEEDTLVEVPKYLQGIPLVDPHTEKLGEV